MEHRDHQIAGRVGLQPKQGDVGDFEVSSKEYSNLKKSWELLGEEDSLWAILSSPGKERGGWDIDEFLATGRVEIDQLFSGYLNQVAVDPARERALDFGCGVGRLTHALARYFTRVDGLDISSAMISQAEQIHANCEGLRFHLLGESEFPFDDDTFDFIYCRLVLQHIPTELAIGYISQFVRVLKPGGLAVFQAPSRQRVQGEVLPSPVQLSGGTAYIEMHVLPRELIESTVAAAGGRIVDIREDDCAGEAFESLRYAVTV